MRPVSNTIRRQLGAFASSTAIALPSTPSCSREPPRLRGREHKHGSRPLRYRGQRNSSHRVSSSTFWPIVSAFAEEPRPLPDVGKVDSLRSITLLWPWGGFEKIELPGRPGKRHSSVRPRQSIGDPINRRKRPLTGNRAIFRRSSVSDFFNSICAKRPFGGGRRTVKSLRRLRRSSGKSTPKAGRGRAHLLRSISSSYRAQNPSHAPVSLDACPAGKKECLADTHEHAVGCSGRQT